MTMHTADSDRDYAEFLNPSEPEGEDPDNLQGLAFEEITEEEIYADDNCPF